jgi:hypothetical protein
MGYDASEIIPRFVKYAGLPHGKEPDGKKGRLRERFPDGSGSSLYYGTTGSWTRNNEKVVEIDSYGSHYPLARLVLTPSGKRRLWVLNGDEYGDRGFARTGTHQQMAREAAQASGTPWVILPFSALREAGIDPDTIHVVHQERERWEAEEHSAATLEQVPEAHRRHRAWQDATGAIITPPRASDGTEAWADYDGQGWHVYRRSALEGSQNIPVPGPAYEAPLDIVSVNIEPGPDGRYHWSEQRHWLGESVFRASYTRYAGRDRGYETRKHAYFLSAFDTNEARPLYFLAELPRGARPQTVAEAREALKPPQVLAAEAQGISVMRQGDVFAIPRPDLVTRDLPGPSQRGALVLKVNHKVTEMRVTPDGRTFARGTLRHARRPAEHAAIQLGDSRTWHELCPKTLPAFPLGNFLNVRAWTTAGRVD